LIREVENNLGPRPLLEAFWAISLHIGMQQQGKRSCPERRAPARQKVLSEGNFESGDKASEPGKDRGLREARNMEGMEAKFEDRLSKSIRMW
jgi:hypothetical protein